MTNPSSKPLKLSDAQLVLLSTASQHREGLFRRSDGGAARTLSALIGRGLLAESPEGARLTAKGYAALGIEPPQSPMDKTCAGKEGGEAADFADDIKPTSKQALVIGLLSRSQGATLDDLVTATGWLPHTTRAALTGLRKKGFALDSEKPADGPRVYRISGKAAAAAA